MFCFVFIFKKKRVPAGIIKNVKAFLLRSPNVEANCPVTDCPVPVTANQLNVAL